MDSPLSLPWRLHQANLALRLDFGRLLQENARRWAGCRWPLCGQVVAAQAAEARALRAAHDWPGLATLPADAFWRQLQVRLREGQALAQVAITAQTAIANGLQQALRTWRKDSAAALGEALGGVLEMEPAPAASASAPATQWHAGAKRAGQTRSGRAGGLADGDDR
jgi:hypothetical protein